MRLPFEHRRATLRAIGAGGLLAISISLSGCALFDDLEPGENIADAYGEFAGFCGFLQDCGNHGGSDNNNEPPADSSSSASSGSSSGSGTGGQGASTPN